VHNVSIIGDGGLTGQFQIGRDLLGTFQIDYPALEPAIAPQVAIGRDLLGQVVVPRNLATPLQLTAGSIGAGGAVHIAGSVVEGGLLELTTTSGVAGQVLIEGNLAGQASIAGGLAEGGSLDVTGSLATVYDPDPRSAAKVAIDNVAGTVNVTGNIAYDAGVEVGSLTGALNVGGYLAGHIYVDQSLSGLIDVVGVMGDGNANHPFAGRIRVNGSFGPLAPNDPPPKIWVHTPYDANYVRIIGPTAYVSVDFDGWQNGDDWDASAEVRVGPAEGGLSFYGNTPARHLWHISECRGDLNGDSAVGFGDLSPFVMGLNNPAGYATTYPGLAEVVTDETGTHFCGGSAVFHGDANCDGSYAMSDMSAFMLLVNSGCCDPDCPGCSQQRGDMMYEGGEGLPGLPAEELAAELAANIWPELYPDLVAMVAANIDLQPHDESQAYWQAVYAALTQ
jgi:hypothetical protein